MASQPITVRRALEGERHFWWTHAQVVDGRRDEGRVVRPGSDLIVLNAYAGAKLVGSACLQPFGPDEEAPKEFAEEGPFVRPLPTGAWRAVALKSLYVVPKQRRRGVARLLAAEAAQLGLPLYAEFRWAFLSRYFAAAHAAA